MKTEEREKMLRVKLRALADVAQEDPSTGLRSEAMGSVTELGADGVRFEAAQVFELGAGVTVCFSVGERIVEGRGRVTHFAPTENDAIATDVEFTEISAGDREFIEEFCRTRAAHA